MRLGGEVHIWIYDRCSIRVLLGKYGFADFKVCKADESRIPEFNSYGLDLHDDGSCPKTGFTFCGGGEVLKPQAAKEENVGLK